MQMCTYFAEFGYVVRCGTVVEWKNSSTGTYVRITYHTIIPPERPLNEAALQ